MDTGAWMALIRVVERSRRRTVPWVSEDVAIELAQHKLVRAYRHYGDLYVAIPTHRGERALAHYRKTVVPSAWPC